MCEVVKTFVLSSMFEMWGRNTYLPSLHTSKGLGKQQRELLCSDCLLLTNTDVKGKTQTIKTSSASLALFGLILSASKLKGGVNSSMFSNMTASNLEDFYSKNVCSKSVFSKLSFSGNVVFSLGVFTGLACIRIRTRQGIYSQI